MTDTPNTRLVELTEAQVDLVYGMLTQRLYLRETDPDRTEVINARTALYGFTSHFRETTEAKAIVTEAEGVVDLEQPTPLEEARAEFEAARTPAVLAGLDMVKKGLGGGTMCAEPAPGPGYGPQPSKIAHLVAFATISGSHGVQAEFDRYIVASDRLARISTGQDPDEPRFVSTGYGVDPETGTSTDDRAATARYLRERAS